jgi:spermidine synthase
MAAPLTHRLIKDGWFSEEERLWPGQRFGLQVKEILHVEHTGFQDLLIFDSETYGRVLVLDGAIQVTERDEFSYQEMIVNIPMFAHPNPKSVFIVGGGDGGALREVVRHSCVERVVMCDIDGRVIELSKKYFKDCTATSFDDPRLELAVMDAAEFIKAHPGEFDVVIVDSSDPVGPAESLYTSEFYDNMKKGLRAGGIICTQGECQWLHLDIIRRVLDDAKTLFGTSAYCYTTTPTYPSGQIGFVVACLDSSLNFKQPNRAISPELQEKFRYYSADIHRASFVLPEFTRKALYGPK